MICIRVYFGWNLLTPSLMLYLVVLCPLGSLELCEDGNQQYKQAKEHSYIAQVARGGYIVSG